MRSALVALATALVILGASIIPFTTPVYVRAEQDRVGVGRLTGFDRAELDSVTSSLLADVLLWTGDFRVVVDGEPVLSDRERGHMVDVRSVFTIVWLVVVVAAAVLVLAGRRARADEQARVAAWRAVGAGARWLAFGTIILSILAAIAFNLAFDVFHRLFFSGNFTFDPATDRLVQLFPQVFWADTVAYLGGVLFAIAVAVAWVAARRSRARFDPALAAGAATSSNTVTGVA